MYGDAAALLHLLTSARARTSPGSFEQLRPIRRDNRGRHAADSGLTQEMMDLLLGRSSGTYGRFERRQKNPEYLFLPIARHLDLSHQEWNSLWLYALGKEPPHPLDPGLGLGVAGAWRLVVEATPVASYINDRDWGLVCWNKELERLFDGRPVPENMMRWILTDPFAKVMLPQ
jgi:hypothetical protein